jgi:hypothetical protein
MKLIFNIVAHILFFIAKRSKMTYNEINIIVYYFLIPFSWLILLDIIFDFHYLKITFVLLCILFFTFCKNFRVFSDRLFEKSVSFLNFFNRFGSNYVSSSVWICVAIPIIVYIILILLI